MPSPPTRSRGRLAALLSDRRGALIVLGAIIAVFIIFGVVWGLTHPEAFAKPTGDGVYFEIMVKQMLTRGVYAYKSTEPNAWRTPAYPLLLAGVYSLTGDANSPGGPYLLIYWIQLLFAAGSIALTYLIGSELFGRGPGLMAALLMAVYPPMQQSAVKILTEPLTMVLLLGYVYVQLLALRKDKKPLWLAAGVLFGATVLARPSFVVIGVVPVLYVLATKRDWRRLAVPAGLLFAGFALVIAPWATFNMVTLHRPVILADQTGDPLLAGVDPYHYELGAIYRYAGPSYVDYVKMRAAGPPYPAGYELMKGEYGTRVIGTMLRHQPLKTIEWFTLGKLRSMFARLWEDGGGRTMTSITWVIQFAVVAFGFMGMALSLRDRRFRLPTFMILLAVAALLPYVPEPRYVFPLMPLLAVLAAGTMMRAWSPRYEEPASTAAIP